MMIDQLIIIEKEKVTKTIDDDMWLVGRKQTRWWFLINCWARKRKKAKICIIIEKEKAWLNQKATVMIPCIMTW